MRAIAQYSRREVEDVLEGVARDALGFAAPGFKMSQATWKGDNGLELTFDEVEPDEDADEARSY